MSLRSKLEAKHLADLRPYRVPATPPPIKLDANELSWPASDSARARIAEALATTDFHRYPDGRATRVRDALAAKFGGAPDEYVLGSGSDELIALIASALSRPRSGAEHPVLVVPEPTFVMYAVTSGIQRWRTVGVPLTDEWALDADAMQEALTQHQPNVVYYARPNNPTGNQFDASVLRALVEGHPSTLHVIDEAYGAYASDTLAHWADEYEQVAILGTLSKVGFAAARVGWIRCCPDIASSLEKVRQPFNLNALSQTVAELALTELASDIDAQVRAVVQSRQELTEQLSALPGLHVFPSEANFVLVTPPSPAAELHAALLERGIAVRRFSDPRLADHLRITIGQPAENAQLISELTAIWGAP